MCPEEAQVKTPARQGGDLRRDHTCSTFGLRTNVQKMVENKFLQLKPPSLWDFVTANPNPDLLYFPEGRWGTHMSQPLRMLI